MSDGSDGSDGSGYDSRSLRALAALAQPQSPEDNLDGVTRETLVQAEIAKHKEVLEPPPGPEPPITVILPALTQLADLQEHIARELAKIRDVLRDILKEIRNVTLEDPEASADDESSGEEQELLQENGDTTDRG